MIVIAGYGYVGKAIDEALSQHEHVEIVDPAVNDNRVCTFGVDAESVIIAVSTPEAPDGSCYMQNVYDVLDDCPQVPILLKSTISIDGWKELKLRYPNKEITFSPEFLRAITATEDFANQPCVFLGGGNIDYWQSFFVNILGKVSTVSTPEELILAKYFRNSFLATKVTFFNQMYDLCDQLDIDYEQVKSVVTADNRIGHSHSEVTKERGYGGHCLPKDTQALVQSALHNGCSLSLLREVIRYNKKIQKSSEHE